MFNTAIAALPRGFDNIAFQLRGLVSANSLYCMRGRVIGARWMLDRRCACCCEKATCRVIPFAVCTDCRLSWCQRAVICALSHCRACHRPIRPRYLPLPDHRYMRIICDASTWAHWAGLWWWWQGRVRGRRAQRAAGRGSRTAAAEGPRPRRRSGCQDARFLRMNWRPFCAAKVRFATPKTAVVGCEIGYVGKESRGSCKVVDFRITWFSQKIPYLRGQFR